MKLLIGIGAVALSTIFMPMMFSTSVAQQPQTRPRQVQQPTPRPSPQEVEQDEVVRIDTELVTLTATITDARGRYRAGLRQGDFTVYEDGVKQELAYFNSDRVPMSLGILFDTSGSMIDKIDGVKDAVQHFVKSVTPGDEIFLIRFSDDAEFVQDFTDNRDRIARAVEDLEPRGSTSLYEAVQLGLQKMNSARHRKRALLLVTDGKDTASRVKFKDVLEQARKSEVIIYAMGIGHGEKGSFGHDNSGGVLGSIFGRQSDDVDMKVLNAFADATGGRGFHLENAHRGGRDLIDEAAEEVANELKQQYTLGYRPTNRNRDGSFRQIKVETADKSLRVRTKRGYYASRSS